MSFISACSCYTGVSVNSVARDLQVRDTKCVTHRMTCIQGYRPNNYECDTGYLIIFCLLKNMKTFRQKNIVLQFTNGRDGPFSGIKVHIEDVTSVFKYSRNIQYRSGTVNSKSFVGKVLLRIKRKFELN